MSVLPIALASLFIGIALGFGIGIYMAPHRKAVRWRKRLLRIAARKAAAGQRVEPPLDYAANVKRGHGTLSEDYRLRDDYKKPKPVRS